MTAQQNGIRAFLLKQGWEIVEINDDCLEWWADEIWLLRSSCLSKDYIIYLTFVVDPQRDGPRKKGQYVWAVTAAPDQPQQWSNVVLDLGRGWKKRLPSFLAELSTLPSPSLDSDSLNSL